MKMNKLDPYTFGNSDCEIVLAKLLTLSGDERLVGSVTHVLSNLSRRLKILIILDKKTRDFMYPLLRKHYFQKLDLTLIAKNRVIRGYVENAMNKRLKKWLYGEYFVDWMGEHIPVLNIKNEI